MKRTFQNSYSHTPKKPNSKFSRVFRKKNQIIHLPIVRIMQIYQMNKKNIKVERQLQKKRRQ